MKANIKIIAAMLLGLLVASCDKKDERMLTVINEDGSCSREYTFKTTQQWLAIPQDEDLDSVVDKSWERTWSIQGADSVRRPVPLTEAQLDSLQEQDLSKPLGNMLMLHVRKQFATVQDMSNHLYTTDNDHGTHLVKLEGFKASSTLAKRFKWFYTDYAFTETFVYDDPDIFPIPIGRFLSADTVAFWLTRQPDLTQGYRSGAELKEMLDGIEAKISQWGNANWFTEICRYIISNYDKLENPPLSKERFASLCDSLAMTPAVLNTPDNEARTSSFRNVLGKYANSEVYDQFLQSDPSGPALPKGYSQLMSFNTTYDLVMPGRVTDAGIGEYDGQVVHYRISGDRFIGEDHTLTISATSRVTNVWAFIVTGLVILLALGSFFIHRIRLK